MIQVDNSARIQSLRNSIIPRLCKIAILNYMYFWAFSFYLLTDFPNFAACFRTYAVLTTGNENICIIVIN